MNKIARNIYIDDNTWQKIRIISIQKKKSVSQIVRELMKEFLIKENIIEEETPII